MGADIVSGDTLAQTILAALGIDHDLIPVSKVEIGAMNPGEPVEIKITVLATKDVLKLVDWHDMLQGCNVEVYFEDFE